MIVSICSLLNIEYPLFILVGVFLKVFECKFKFCCCCEYMEFYNEVLIFLEGRFWACKQFLGANCLERASFKNIFENEAGLFGDLQCFLGKGEGEQGGLFGQVGD